MSLHAHVQEDRVVYNHTDAHSENYSLLKKTATKFPQLHEGRENVTYAKPEEFST